MDKNKKLYIGSNINTKWGFVSSAKYANKIGANFYQIFLASPHQYKNKRHSDSELLELKNELDKYSIKIVIHASYMLNFCNPCNSFKHKSAIRLLEEDLKESSKLGAIGVIVHMGKSLDMDEEDAISNFVKGVQETLKNTPNDSTIIFETGAGQGTEICTDIIELGKLYRRFTNKERKRIKFCIDTCHVFSAGYDLGNKEYVDIFCDLVECNLSWDNIACIHLNDSKCPLDCRKDRHADITKGFINSKGLKKFVKICYEKSMPMILETPCDTSLGRCDQIRLIKSWVE